MVVMVVVVGVGVVMMGWFLGRGVCTWSAACYFSDFFLQEFKKGHRTNVPENGTSLHTRNLVLMIDDERRPRTLHTESVA